MKKRGEPETRTRVFCESFDVNRDIAGNGFPEDFGRTFADFIVPVSP